MDPRPTDQERKRQLIRKLDGARSQLRRDQERLRQTLSPIYHVRKAITKNPLMSFSLASGAAFVLSSLRRRRSSHPTTAKRHLLRWILHLAKPALHAWLLEQAKSFLLHPPKTASNTYEANTP